MVWIAAVLVLGQHGTLAQKKADFEVRMKHLEAIQRGDTRGLTTRQIREAVVAGPVVPVAYVPNGKSDSVHRVLWRHGIGDVVWQVAGLPIEIDVLNAAKAAKARNLILRTARRHHYLRFVLHHPVKR